MWILNIIWGNKIECTCHIKSETGRAVWLQPMNDSNQNPPVDDQLDIERPSGGGGLIGIGGMGIWGAPGAPGGSGGTGIPPGGGGGMLSFNGRGPIPLIRGGGRFTPAGGGGPLDGGTAFSILKWNWRKNYKEKRKQYEKWPVFSK